MRLLSIMLASALAGACFTPSALAQKVYGPGVTDKEIKIGNIMPYSGPASAYGVIGKTETAFFQMINDQGGINGRRIDFISYDDGYSPPKTVEQARKLVENDNVLMIFNSLGTPPNSAIQKYMNEQKVPQLFVATGASKWDDPTNFPWTMGWQPSYQAEARIYAKYILKTKPNAKIAILYQDDDYGKDYLKGFLDGLNGKLRPVAQLTYETTDATIDSQMTQLQSSGADTFFNITTPKFAAMAIRKAHELGWKPTQFLNNVSASVGSVLKPAGFDAAQGVISTGYLKDANDPSWKDDAGYKRWAAFVDKYMPGADKSDLSLVYGYTVAQTLVHVLRTCGDDLSRANVMKQASNIRNLSLDMLLPGIKVNTSPTNFAPIQQEELEAFRGDRWNLFGEVYDAATLEK